MMPCVLGNHTPQDFYLDIYHHKNLKSDVDYIHFALNYTKCRIKRTAHSLRPPLELYSLSFVIMSYLLQTLS